MEGKIKGRLTILPNHQFSFAGDEKTYVVEKLTENTTNTTFEATGYVEELDYETCIIKVNKAAMEGTLEFTPIHLSF